MPVFVPPPRIHPHDAKTYVAVQNVPMQGGGGHHHGEEVVQQQEQQRGRRNNRKGGEPRRRPSDPQQTPQLERPNGMNRRRSMSVDDLDTFDMNDIIHTESLNNLYNNMSSGGSNNDAGGGYGNNRRSLHSPLPSVGRNNSRQRVGSRGENNIYPPPDDNGSVHSNMSNSVRRRNSRYQRGANPSDDNISLNSNRHGGNNRSLPSIHSNTLSNPHRHHRRQERSRSDFSVDGDESSVHSTHSHSVHSRQQHGGSSSLRNRQGRSKSDFLVESSSSDNRSRRSRDVDESVQSFHSVTRHLVGGNNNDFGSSMQSIHSNSSSHQHIMDGGGSNNNRHHARGRSDFSIQSTNSRPFDDSNRHVSRRDNNRDDGGGSLQSESIPSIEDSLQRRHQRRRSRKSSDYSVSDDGNEDDDDDDDYMVGRGQSISSNSRRRRRRPSDASGSSIDMSGRAGGDSRDTWSISKSVFETFQTDQRSGRGRRDRGGRGGGGDASYDDDDNSLFSTSSAYSYRRTPSRSSSVASRVSQLSEESSSKRSGSSHPSFRFPNNRRVNRDSTYEYDSDDSLGSILGAIEHHPRAMEQHSIVEGDDLPSTIGSTMGDEISASSASGSFLFDNNRKKKKKNNDESSLSKGEEAAANFGDTLSHLKGLGLGIDDDDLDGDDEDSVSRRRDKRASLDDMDDDSAWWISDLEGEGWFQHDTTTVYSSKIVPKQLLQPQIAVDTMAEGNADLVDEALEGPRESSGAIVTDDQPNSQTDYDSDTSTVGMEEKDVEDWEERLWTLARSHYLEYTGGEKKASADSEVRSILEQASITGSIDEQSIKDQEELYQLDIESEQKSVLMFRSLLLKCIETFVNAFHQKFGQRGNSSSSEDIAAASKAGDQALSDHLASLKVYRYIPMSTARDLFLEVIKMADDNSFMPEVEKMDGVTTSVEKRADVVTSILVDDVLNIFRRYQVITMKTSTKIGSNTKKSRKRLSKGAAKSSGAQAELEDYLYGEMNEDDQEDEQGTPEILETMEHEIRIRSDVIRGVLSKRAKSAEIGGEITNSCWESSLICKVLLSNIQSITTEASKEKAHNQEENKDQNEPTSSSVSFTEQPMAHLYSLRYSPVFLLRALASHRLQGTQYSDLSSSTHDPPSLINLHGSKLTYKDMTNLLFDNSYLMKRFELQGPYDATITHLSNWQSTFVFYTTLTKYKHGDEDKEFAVLHTVIGDDDSYEKFVALIVSSLHSHLETILVNTGYHESKSSEGEDDNVLNTLNSSNEGQNISIHNYANIVANCLEIGRALHHLGVCLGRKQRDSANNQNGEVLKKDLVINGEADDAVNSNGAVNPIVLEIKAYKDALDAYKAAIYVLSKAEKSVTSNTIKDVGFDQRRRGINGDVQQQREAPNTYRDTSETRDMPNDELQEIREAKISAELHLADTLNCLGYCHDSKLSEYDKSLMAYRESLSLYIRHVGRFHTMVSNALHNMGAIHVELGQWREAVGCFRQCLSILKRKEEKEQTNNANPSQELQQKYITLQCLGNSLSELGEYDSSIACFQEILSASQTSDVQELEPNSFAVEIKSQMGRVHIKQASKLTQSFNWQCHLSLFSGTETKNEEDPSSMLSRQLQLERTGKECILKSIHARRKVCYSTSTDETEPEGDIFSSVDNKNEGDISQLRLESGKEPVFRVSADVSSDNLTALAKDLLVVGRVEFRSRSYKAALSYFWESLLVNGLLISQSMGNVAAKSEICNLLVFDNDFLKSGEMLFQVPENILDVIDLVPGIPSAMDSTGIEYAQLLFLIGVIFTRQNDTDQAKKILLKAQSLINPRFSEPDRKSKGNLGEAVLQLDIAFLNLRLGFVDHELGNFEVAASKYKEAIKVFNSLATHPILSIESKGKSDTAKRKTTSHHELQRKELDMIRKNGFACALHRLGQTRIGQEKYDKAKKCFEDTARMLNEINIARSEFSNGKAVSSSSQFASRCCWEEVSAISTSMILSDANERSGKIGMTGSGSDTFSLQCFERAIGMRDSVTSTFGPISSVDAECSLDCFEEGDWDIKNMDCYLAMLKLIEKMDRRKKNKAALDIWDGNDLDLDGEQKQNEDDGMLTKEDVLFRIGNLQMKMGKFRDAIKSYMEAEELTVSRLGSKDHAIVMNILHNLGNAHRAVSLASSSKEAISAKEDAIACYLESIRISQVSFGKQHATSAESMQDMAVLYMKARNLCLAISHEEQNDDNDDEFAYKSFKDALAVRRKENSSQSELEMAVTLQHLGDLCLKKISLYYQIDDGDTLKFVDEAMNFLAECLKIRKLLLSHDDVNIGDTYQSIGIAHLNRALALKNDANKLNSEMGKAHKALTSALEVRRKFSSTFTQSIDDSKLSVERKDSILMEAHCMFYLGRVEEIRSKFDEAKSHYNDALQHFQAEGKRRLSQLNDIKAKHDVDLEGKLMMELEAINLWAARVLYHMASIHKAKGNLEDSINCYEEALRIRSQCKSTKKNGLNNALIHLDLARAFHDNENYDKAIEYYSQSLRTYLAYFGKDSTDVAETLTGMGKSFAMKGIYEKSMQCYDKAMRALEYREGPAMKEKKGLLHREIADTVQRLDGDVFEVLEHYRSSVSFLEEYNERHRAVAISNDKIDPNMRLLLYYSEMLAILRDVLSMERDRNIRSELRDEIGDVLHRMGNLHATFTQYDEAMSCFTEVLQTQRKTNNDELRIADLLFNMGNIYLEQGLPEESLDCLRESYDITKEALGEDSSELHSTMYLMSVAMTNIGDYESASRWLKQALSVLKNNDDENAVDKASRGKTLNQMGTVYEKTGDQGKAISCLRESIQILKAIEGEDRELSNALNSMGNMLRNISDFDQALDCYNQSLILRTDLGDELLIANTKNNIGAGLSAIGKLDRAMAFSAEALRIKTERLGSDCIETGRALVNVSCIGFHKICSLHT